MIRKAITKYTHAPAYYGLLNRRGFNSLIQNAIANVFNSSIDSERCTTAMNTITFNSIASPIIYYYYCDCDTFATIKQMCLCATSHTTDYTQNSVKVRVYNTL